MLRACHFFEDCRSICNYARKIQQRIYLKSFDLLDEEGVYAGGDIVTGAATVMSAILVFGMGC